MAHAALLLNVRSFICMVEYAPLHANSSPEAARPTDWLKL